MTTCLPCVIGTGTAGHPSCGRMVRPGNRSDAEPVPCGCNCERAAAARAELAAEPVALIPAQRRR